jgi:hypothetical protein
VGGGGGGGGSTSKSGFIDANGIGGGFGAAGGGGGGAGGVGYGSLTLTAGTYNIVVGNGGRTENNGGNSTITGGTINETAYGGGAGGRGEYEKYESSSGGSVGGTGSGGSPFKNNRATKGNGTLTYYGYEGGVCGGGAGGGGGGAGAGGAWASNIIPGNGAKGWLCPINNLYYGGGGGGGWQGNKPTCGGCYLGYGLPPEPTGSGGDGGYILNTNFPGTDGTANTGGGGGGGTNGSVGGAGGSGIVIFQITTTSSPNPPPAPPSSPPPSALSPNYTANYNIYTVVDHVPVMLRKNTRLSCVSDDCKQNSRCLDVKLGKNMAISFQVILNKSNINSQPQQIFGITTDACGTDKRVFGAWLGQSGIYLDTSIVNPAKGTDYSTINNKQDLANFQATIGKSMRVDILCNFNQQIHEIYVNGVLTATQTFYQSPYFSSGSAYIFSTFNEFQCVDGTIRDLVFLTSESRTFKIYDLTMASDFIDTDLRGKESFQNIYSPQTGGGYSSDDLRGMQTELLQEINNFNQGYSNYMKYMFNQRHNQTGDTTEKMALYDLSGSKISDSDFAQLNIMDMYANLPESQVYNNLIKDLAVFNQAIKSSATDMSYNITTTDTNTMTAFEKKLVNYRSELDQQLTELNETENSIFAQSNRNMKSQTFQTILLTTLATSLVFYVFVHSE